MKGTSSQCLVFYAMDPIDAALASKEDDALVYCNSCSFLRTASYANAFPQGSPAARMYIRSSFSISNSFFAKDYR
jgi:hypothetical protein